MVSLILSQTHTIENDKHILTKASLYLSPSNAPRASQMASIRKLEKAVHSPLAEG